MDERALYAAIGRYVLAFQGLESLVRETIWFASDPDRTGKGRGQMAEETFGRLISRLERVTNPFVRAWAGDGAARAVANLSEVATTCRILGRERNAVLHAGYIYFESGDDLYGVTRAYMKRTPEDGVRFEYEDLTEDSFESRIVDVGNATLAVGRLYRQLIAWYRPTATSG